MLLSIIIPAYNAEHFISNCLDSVFRTKLPIQQYEVVVIDDGSKDRTSEIAQECKTRHPNMTVVVKENSGVSSARNRGIEIAKGTYVLFLDADDELIDNSLEKVANYLQGIEPVDMLVTRQTRFNGNNDTLTPAPSLEEHKRYNGVEAYKSKYVRTNAGGGICRTSFLRQHKLIFPEGVRNGEDGVFFAHVQVFIQSIVYYNIALYRINVIEGSASRNDHTKIGLSLVETLKAAASIKSSLKVSDEQKGIFDYVVYQMLSNASGWFAESKELNYRKLRELVDINKLLPLHTSKMYLMKNKAQFMNFSFPLFYFMCWVNSRFNK